VTNAAKGTSLAAMGNHPEQSWMEQTPFGATAVPQHSLLVEQLFAEQLFTGQLKVRQGQTCAARR